MTKTIKWNADRIFGLKRGHVFNDMTDEITAYSLELAAKNDIDYRTAQIIVLCLMANKYEEIKVSNTKIELKFGSGNADVINDDCIITAYVCGTKAFLVRIENYLNDLYDYLR